MRIGGWVALCNTTFANGSVVQFAAYDTVGKAKAAGKRGILFLNECNHIPFAIADALISRSRVCWFDFNPDKKFWVHKEILEGEYESEFLTLTYKDNEAIPKETLDFLMIRKRKAEEEERQGKKGHWWFWWQCYGLGRLARMVDKLVFPKAERGTEIPETANFLTYGVDFSNSENQSSDPHAIVGTYYSDHNLYVKAIYEGIAPVDKVKNGEIVFSRTEPTDLSSICLYQCDGVNKYGERLFVTDRANDGDRKLLERHGVNTTPSKGKLVSEGINAINRYNKVIIIDDQGWLWDEFENYMLDTDKDGEIIAGKPAPRQADHGIKATMYALEPWDR